MLGTERKREKEERKHAQRHRFRGLRAGARGLESREGRRLHIPKLFPQGHRGHVHPPLHWAPKEPGNKGRGLCPGSQR